MQKVTSVWVLIIHMWADCVSLIVQPGLFWSTVLCRSSGLGFQSWSSTQRSPVPWSPSRWQAPHNSDLPLTKKGTLYNSWNNWWKDYKKKNLFIWSSANITEAQTHKHRKWFHQYVKLETEKQLFYYVKSHYLWLTRQDVQQCTRHSHHLKMTLL